LRNEIEGGMRTVLKVLLILGVGSLIIYLAGTSTFLAILPQSQLTRLAGFPDALRAGLNHVALGGYAPLVIGLFALSMMGSLTGWFGVGARLPFAAGLDHFLPQVFGKRHPKTGAPVAAILLQAALMVIFVGLSQAGTSVAAAYDFLVAVSVLGSTIPYLFMFAGYLKAARLPDAPGVWRPAGGVRTSILLGWMAQVSCLIAIACTLVPSSGDPHPWIGLMKIVLSAAAMFGVGALFYWLADRGRKAALALAPAE